MKKSVIIFLATFVVGALTALALRTAKHDPYKDVPEAPVQPGYKSMVENTLAAPKPPAAHDGAHNQTALSTGTVNTICAICGMPVDPTIPAVMYEGRLVGFGCKRCPPEFAADPERYGPSALRNEEAE